MQATTQRLEEVRATVQAFGVLSDPGRVWRVIEGSVDLFLVRTENGVPVGARRPVARVAAGEVVFGAGIAPEGDTLMAQPTPRSTVAECDWDSITEESVARWLNTLGSTLGVMLPRTLAALEPCQQASLTAGQAVGCNSGVRFLRVLSGSVQLLAWPPLEPLTSGAVVAVSSAVWLAPENEARVECLAPCPEDVRAAMAMAHARLLEALDYRSRQSEAQFAARLANRAGNDRASFQLAQRALSSVLAQQREAAAAAVGDPLLQAASAVGEAMGIRIVAPQLSARIASKDPVADIAAASGIRVRTVTLKRRWWREDGGPLLGFTAEERRPVALLPQGPARYTVFDPASGGRRAVNAKEASLVSATAYCFYRPFPAEKLNYASLVRFGMRGLRRDAASILLCGALSGLLGLVSPVASGILFDSIIPATDRAQLTQMFGILMAAAIATWMLQLLQSFALLRVESRMDANLQAALWDRLMSLPVTFFRGFTAGDLASRSLTISTMRQFLTGTVLSAVLSGVFSLFSIALLFHYGGSFAIPALGLVAVSFFIAVGSAFLQLKVQRRLTELSGRVAGLLPQLLGGIAKLRASGAEERAFARWALRFAEQKRLAVRGRRITIALSIVFPVFRAGTMMALFAFLARRGATASGLTTGTFLAFQAAFLQLLAATTELGSSLVSALAVVPLYERAKPILDALPEVSGNKVSPGEITGDVELAHLAFRYRPDLPPVLKDVNLRIRAGQFVAIVGGTGSGKSTLFRLMLGFEAPESGSIFFDGKDLATLDVQAIRRQTGVVLQQGGVLGGDLFSNIVGPWPLTVDDAWEAARMAGLEEDIRNMPMGMNTVVPEGGLGLSGGQRQRLQIARAIVNRPRLLFFDEATSALDNQTQAVVTESLSRLKATRIVIAHRLSTIRDADCIFVLNQGVVEESGTFDELMARNGYFAELARRQLA